MLVLNIRPPCPEFRPSTVGLARLRPLPLSHTNSLLIPTNTDSLLTPYYSQDPASQPAKPNHPKVYIAIVSVPASQASSRTQTYSFSLQFSTTDALLEYRENQTDPALSHAIHLLASPSSSASSRLCVEPEHRVRLWISLTNARVLLFSGTSRYPSSHKKAQTAPAETGNLAIPFLASLQAFKPSISF